MADAAGLHREMFEVVQRHDLAALRELYHADYVYRGTDGTEAGIEAGMKVAETYTNAFPDISFEFVNQFTPKENVSIIEGVATGTHKGDLEGVPATGKTVRIPICNIIEVKDGKILREREYFDAFVMMQQLGVAPS